MIVVDNIGKEFQLNKKETNKVLKGISFQVKKGEVFGLLGPNGAGKSTFLRILSTMMKPTNGTFSIHGHDGLLYPEKIKETIGYLSTETGLYDKLTPREFLSFFGQTAGLDKNLLNAKVDNILDEFGLLDKADMQMGNFSTGMKQKVSIARSLLHDPEVIIFDEPTNGLDIINRHVVKKILIDMKKQGKTIILSTHLMNEVEDLCDTVGIIHQGKLIAYGEKEALKMSYQVNEIEELFFRLVGDTYELI